MNVPFLLAGILAVTAAAIHGAGGDAWVLRKLFAGPLPSTRFGSPTATRAMVHVTWHVATFTFLVLGAALTTCGVLGSGEACRGIGAVAATCFSGFVAICVVVVLLPPRAIFFHLGPVAFLAIAALAWWGTLAS